MKLKHLGVISCACAVLFLASCGSTPTAEEELDFNPSEKAEETVEQTVEETTDFTAANQASLEIAEKARQAAVKADAQKYYQENKDKLTDKSRIYYQENKDKVKDNVRSYYQKNRDRICEQKKEYRRKKKEENIQNNL